MARSPRTAGTLAAPSGRTSDRLLQVAAHLFRERGYDATTTRELAEALGIQKASLYHHMKGKEDLLYRISTESLRTITESVAGAAAMAEPDERLTAMIERHVETALADRDLHTVMLIELRALSPDRAREIRALRDRYETLVREQVAEDQAAGRLRDDIDTRWLTMSLLNLLNWTIFWYDPAGDRSAAEIARTLATVFLEGARSEPAAPAG